MRLGKATVRRQQRVARFYVRLSAQARRRGDDEYAAELYRRADQAAQLNHALRDR